MTPLRPKHLWFGALIALYLLIGRWGFHRLTGEGSAHSQLILEIRFWVVLLLATGLLFLPAPQDIARRRRNQPVLVVMLVLFAYVLASAVWGPDGNLAMEKAYDVALVAAATLILLRVFASAEGPHVALGFWIATLVFGCILAAIGLWTVTSGGAGERLSVLGGGPNIYGRMMGYLAIAALFLWRRYGLTAVFLPLASLAGILIILTGSRGSMVSLAVALCVFAVFEMRSVTRLAVALVVAVMVSLLTIRSTAIGGTVVDRYQERVQLLMFAEQYTSGRDVLYRQAYELGASHPAFGAGLAAFPGLGLGVYPHNIFLELFCETGAFGLALFCAVLALAVRAPRQVEGVALTGLVLVLVASQFSGDFYDSRGVFVFLAAALWLPPSILPATSRGPRVPAPAADPGPAGCDRSASGPAPALPPTHAASAPHRG